MLSGSSSNHYGDYQYSMMQTFDNLDLIVRDPNGIVVGRSHTQMSNFEIVQFVPQISGNYTITVERVSGAATIEPLGIAVW